MTKLTGGNPSNPHRQTAFCCLDGSHMLTHQNVTANTQASGYLEIIEGVQLC